MKKKFLYSLSFIIILFLLFFVSRVSAFSVLHNDELLTFPLLPFGTDEVSQYYIIRVYDPDDASVAPFYYLVSYSCDGDLAEVLKSGSSILQLVVNYNSSTKMSRYIISGNEWVLDGSKSYARSTSSSYEMFPSSFWIKDIIFATEDIYTGSYNGRQTVKTSDSTVFFSRMALTLSMIVEQSHPEEMIPTMIVGLIPCLMLFLVGLVAFWKAWQLLSRLLRKA